ncbi:MAG: response regulator transcription factor [Clostridiaceae bacterium]
MSYKILVVDDEKGIINLLKDYFEIQGYLVYTAFNGVEALEKIEVNPDVILLDINMPQMDGIEVCKRIRDFVTCPILFLTAKVEERDRVNGLMAGGDDYIIKPFSMEELGARVQAHLRREERKMCKDRIRFSKQFIISCSEHKLFYFEEEVALTKTEFDIVELLSMNKGQVFTKEAIYEKLWGFDKDGDSSIITEHIRRIRVKLGKYSECTLIETIWGVGYKWIG